MSKLYVDELHPKTSGSAVRRPDLPAWRLNLNEVAMTSTAKTEVSINTSVSSDITSDNATFMTGGVTASGGKVYVPVTGFYQVNFVGRADDVGSGYFYITIDQNGTDSGGLSAIVDDPSGSHETLTLSCVMYLNANDYIEHSVRANSDTSWHVENNSVLSGFLIG